MEKFKDIIERLTCFAVVAFLAILAIGYPVFIVYTIWVHQGYIWGLLTLSIILLILLSSWSVNRIK